MIINAPFQQLEAKAQPNNSGENNRQLQFSLFFDPFTSMCCLCFDYFLKRRKKKKRKKKKHQAVFSLRVAFCRHLFSDDITSFINLPFSVIISEETQEGRKELPQHLWPWKCTSRDTQPKAECPQRPSRTSPLKGKCVRHWRGKISKSKLAYWPKPTKTQS